MRKNKTFFVCQECGYTSVRWMGKCPACGSWNSMVEEKDQPVTEVRTSQVDVRPISMWEVESKDRFTTGFKNLDEALGGGLVAGQVILIAGEPGIGKSTLLLQVSDRFSRLYGKVLYVSGEESGPQISLRGQRIGVKSDQLLVLSETHLETVLKVMEELSPKMVVVDSVQTLHSQELESSAGSVSQVRECSFRLAEWCKAREIPLFLVGQVNKEGMIAGPKVLEHLVDTVLYFEGERYSFHRVIKVVKNRFGSAGELAVFKMSSIGLEEVPDPSAFFLEGKVRAPGSVIFPSTEGSKPVLLEVQALTIDALYTTPQRRTQGFDPNRLSLILAILEKEAKVFTRDKDVFINVVGGMQVKEPAGDLAVALAVVSSVKGKVLPDLLVFGELGLAGEVRGVHLPELRLKEGAKFGINTAIVPKGCYLEIDGMQILPVSHIREAIEYILENHHEGAVGGG